jgi:F0F1-type ATP synthase assembly protein I
LPRKKQSDDDVRQYIETVRKDVDKRLTDLKSQMDDVQNKAANALKEQPLLVLGITFVAGIAVGIALANAGD